MASITAFDHEVDTFHSHHVGDLVRVAHRSHRAMAHRHPGKLRRRQHRALDMDVCVDKSRHDKTMLCRRQRRNFNNFFVFDGDGSRKNVGVNHIHNLAAQGKGVVVHNIVVLLHQKNQAFQISSFRVEDIDGMIRWL